MHGRRPQHADSVVIMAAKGAALRSSASAESLLDPLSRAAAAPSSIASARSSGGDDKSVLSNELSAQASPAPSVNELQLTASLSDLTCAAPPPPPPAAPVLAHFPRHAPGAQVVISHWLRLWHSTRRVRAPVFCWSFLRLLNRLDHIAVRCSAWLLLQDAFVDSWPG